MAKSVPPLISTLHFPLTFLFEKHFPLTFLFEKHFPLIFLFEKHFTLTILFENACTRGRLPHIFLGAQAKSNPKWRLNCSSEMSKFRGCLHSGKWTSLSNRPLASPTWPTPSDANVVGLLVQRLTRAKSDAKSTPTPTTTPPTVPRGKHNSEFR